VARADRVYVVGVGSLSDACAAVEGVQALFYANVGQGVLEGQTGTPGQIALRPLGFQSVPIVNVENGCASGATALYLAAAELTAAAIVDGWLHTGDIGYLDGAGRLHLCDRKKDMIICGGLNIYPQEIEQVLWTHPAVQDCAVIGAPDPEWGELVTAVVELRPGAAVSAEELIGFCRERLGSVKVPKRLEFVQELPRSPNGKVLKRAIRDQYWTGMARKI
jgi:acyl-CoA synthetase (AMP-forming)/AMP-acid ligase II